MNGQHEGNYSPRSEYTSPLPNLELYRMLVVDARKRAPTLCYSQSMATD